MKVAGTIDEIRSAVAEARLAGSRTVGLVPTMGALHEGHYSLIDAAREGCDFVVVSIFVNPAQFGPGEDLQTYPRPLEADLAGCRARGADAAFVPQVEEMCPPGAVTTVHVAGLTDRLCGASRPGHFDGVCTVVAKLFNTVAPDVAYFGAKDYQQAVVVRRMVRDLDMPVRIEVCPTVREADGLAVSSRNVRLSAEERAEAVALAESLRLAQKMVEAGARGAAEVLEAMRRQLDERAPCGQVDYVQVVDSESLQDVEEITASVVAAVAVRFASVRLIDNMLLTPPRSPKA